MEDYYYSLDYPMKVISLVFYYLTLILGVPGNTFVVYVARLKMKRTINTVGFLNLAIADLLCCLSTLYYVTESTLESIMLAVVVVFFLSWLLYHTVELIIVYSEETSSEAALAVDPLTISLVYFNSCLNPILYVFMGQDFKSNVELSLRRVFERVVSEEGTQMSQTTQSV